MLNWNTGIVASLRRRAAACTFGLMCLFGVVAAPGNAQETPPPQIQYLEGHTSPVYAVGNSPDGKTILSASIDGTIRVWDRASGRLIRTISEHDGPILSLDVASDGRSFATGGLDRTLRIFDLPSLHPLAATSTSLPGLKGRAAISPDGAWLVTGDDARSVRLWNGATGAHVRDFGGSTAPIVGAAILPEAAFVAAAGQDGTLRGWKLSDAAAAGFVHAAPSNALAMRADGKLFALAGEDGVLRCVQWPPAPPLNLAGHSDVVSALALSKDGELLLTGGADQVVQLFSTAAQDGKPLRSLTGQSGKVTAAALSADSKLAATGSETGLIHFWDAESGEDRLSLGGHAGAVRSLAFHPAQPQIISTGADGTVRLWNLPVAPQVLSGHAAAVTSLAPSADGKILVTTGADKSVRLFDLETGKPLNAMEKLPDSITQAVVSRDGKQLAIGDSAGTIRLQPADADKPGETVLGAHTGGVTGLVYHPQGKLLVSSGNDGLVKLWNLPVVPGFQLASHGAAARHALLSRDGTFAVTAGDDKVIRVVNVADGEELRKLEGLNAAPTALALRSDDKQVAAADGNGRVMFWDVESGESLGELAGHAGAVHGLAFHPTEAIIATSGADGTVRLWNVPEPQTALAGHEKAARASAASKDGSVIATAGEDGTVRVWRRNDGKQLQQVSAGKSEVDALALSQSGELIAAGDRAGNVHLWGSLEGSPQGSVGAHGEAISDLAIDPTQKRLATASVDGSVKLWTLPIPSAQKLSDHASAVTGLTLSADGKLAASVGRDKAIQLYELPEAKSLATVEGLPAELTSVALSPDKKIVVAGTAAGSIVLVPVAGGADVQTLSGHTGAVHGLAFHPKEGRIASVGEDGTLHVWELPKPAEKLAGHTKPVTALCLSPDGKTLATAAADNTIRLWDAANGKALKTLSGHQGPVTSLAWQADGKQLVSGSADKTARLWTVADGKMTAEFPAHDAAVNAVAVTPDGKTVATGTADHQIRLWNVEETVKAAAAKDEKPKDGDKPSEEEEKRFRLLEGHKDAVTGLALLANGKTLISASQDGGLRSWNVADGKAGWTTDVKSPISSLALSRDEKLILVGADKLVQTYEASSGKPATTFKNDGQTVASVAFSLDNARAAAATSNGQLYVWETAGRLIERQAFSKKGAAASFGADSRTVFVAAGGPEVLRQQLATISVTAVSETPQHAIVFTPDGANVLTGGADKLVRLVNLADGKPVREFKGCGDAVRSVAVSGDGRFVGAASEDKTARIWETANAKQVAELAHPAAVRAIALSADGAVALTGAADQLVRAWDVSASRPLVRYSLHTKSVNSLALSADGKLVLSGGDDQSVFAIPLSLPQIIPSHGAGAVAVVFTHDGKHLLTGGADKKLKQFDLAGKLIREFAGAGGAVRDLALRHDSTQVAAVCDDKHLYLWTVSNAKQEKKIPLSANANSVSYSPQSDRLLLASSDQSLQVIDPAAGLLLERVSLPAAVHSAVYVDETTIASAGDGAASRIQPLSIIRAFTGHEGAVFSAAFAADGKTLVSGGADKSIKHWNAETGQAIRSISGHEGNVVSVALSSDSQKILSASADKTLRIWTLSNGAPVLSVPLPAAARKIAVSDMDGRGRIAVTTGDSALRVFDLLTGKELERFAGHSSGIGGVDIASDGETLITAGDDKTVRLWHLSAAAVIPADAAKIHDLDLLPDGSHILTAGEDKLVKQWDLSGKLVRQFSGLTAPVRRLAVRPDGEQIAAGGDPSGEQKNVIVWKVADGAALQTISTPAGVTGLGYNANNRLAVAGADKKLRIYSAADKRLLQEMTTPDSLSDVCFLQEGGVIAGAAADKQIYLFHDSLVRVFSGHEGAVADAELIAEGARLITAGADKTVRLWNVADGTELARFTGQTDAVHALAIAGPERNLVGGGADKMLRIWPLDAALGDAPPKDIPSEASIEQPAAVLALACSADGRRVAFSCNGETFVRVWDLSLRKELERLTGHTSNTLALAASPDGTTIFSGNQDKSLRRWQPAVTSAVAAHEGAIRDVVFTPDASEVITAGADQKLLGWNAETLAQTKNFAGAPVPLRAIAISGDGKRLAGVGEQAGVQLWNTADGKPLLAAETPAPSLDVVLDETGSKVILAGEDHTVRNYGVVDGDAGPALDLIHEGIGHTAAVHSLALAADGRTLFSVSDDKSARRWDAVNYRSRRRIPQHDGAIYDVQFSPDNASIATASADRKVRVFSTESGELLFECAGHERQVNAVAFRPDGKELASAGLDGTIRFWNTVPPPAPPEQAAQSPAGGNEDENAGDGKEDDQADASDASADNAGEAAAKEPPPPQLGQQMDVIRSDGAAWYTIRYSPDGGSIYAAGAPASWKLWKRSDLSLVREGIGHNQTIYRLTWNKARTRFATIDFSGNLFIWNPSDSNGLPLYHQQLPVAAGYSISYHPDGAEIVAGTQDSRVLRVMIPGYAR